MNRFRSDAHALQVAFGRSAHALGLAVAPRVPWSCQVVVDVLLGAGMCEGVREGGDMIHGAPDVGGG